jgi:hypothetical protein
MLFYLLPTIAGIYYLYSNLEKQKALPYFISGFLFSISTILCTNVIFYTLLVPILSYYSCRDIKLLIYHSMVGFIGFMIPMVFNVGYFYYHNAFDDFYWWTIKWASMYTAYRPFYERIWSVFWGLCNTWGWIPLVIFSFYGLYILLKKKLYRNDSLWFLALVVFIISVIVRLTLIKSQIRYSLYLLPGLIILLPIAIQYFDLIKSTLIKKSIKVFMAVFLVIAFIVTNFDAYSVSRELIHKRENLHTWIKENTDLNDSIFVWFEGYEIYFKTERKMATSIFSTSQHLDHVRIWEANNYKDIDYVWQKFIYEFKRDKPVLLIDMKPDFGPGENYGYRTREHKKYFDIFKEYLDQNYKPVAVIDKAKIWMRID